MPTKVATPKNLKCPAAKSKPDIAQNVIFEMSKRTILSDKLPLNIYTSKHKFNPLRER